MAKRLISERKRSEPIELEVDGKIIKSFFGENLASAMINEIGMGYAVTKTGESRGPVCNMGVCYECSVNVIGKGKVRACMIKAEDGMQVETQFNHYRLGSQLKESEEVPPLKKLLQKNREIYDVVIIGSGPAGLGAAEELSNKGLEIAIVDEQEQSGGQIYRQPPKEYKTHGHGHDFISGIEHRSDIEWMHGTTVWSILPKEEDGQTDTIGATAKYLEVCLEERESLLTKNVILATGAYERLLAVPGWHLPGVMSAGAIQVFLKSQGILPGEEVFLSGNHPFLLIVAAKIINSGGKVSGIAFTQKFPKFKNLVEYGFKSRKYFKKIKELLSSIVTLRKAEVPIEYGYLPISIKDNSNKKEITISAVKDGQLQSENRKVFESDIVGMCFGFNASSELARQIGCNTEYHFDNGGFITTHNECMQSSISTVYVAGEITGIGGAELSEVEGRLAAYGVMKEKLNINLSTKKIRDLKQQQSKWKSFADMLKKATLVPDGIYNPLLQDFNTYICRCEQITLGQVMETIQENSGMKSLNAIKLKSRCGMGLCQGRNCEDKLRSVLSHYYPEDDMDEHFTPRFPVKPIKIADLIR